MSRKSRKKKSVPKPPASSKCRDCGRTDTIFRYEFFKASKPRCVACGGLMEYGGSWHRTRAAS